MNFRESLLQEERNVVDVRNRSVFDCPTKATMMGPTKVWFHDLKSKSTMIPTSEIKLLKEWKKIDSWRYANQGEFTF